MNQKGISSKMPRRKLLKMIVASACAAEAKPLPAMGLNALHVHLSDKAKDLPSSPTSGFFDKHQMNTIEALSEIIIPTDAHSPGAKAARVDEFVNETVSVSNHVIQKLWIDGIAAIDRMAKLKWGKPFADCGPAQQIKLLTEISQNEDHPETLEERFFVALKQATVEGYYLSEIGIHQDLQYEGNQVLAEFPGCTHEKHRSLKDR